MKREKEGRVLHKRKVEGSLEYIMKGRTVSTNMKQPQQDSKIIPTLAHALRPDHGISLRSVIQAEEMSFLGSFCGVNRMDYGSNKHTVFECCGLWE